MPTPTQRHRQAAFAVANFDHDVTEAQQLGEQLDLVLTVFAVQIKRAADEFIVRQIYRATKHEAVMATLGQAYSAAQRKVTIE